MKTKTMLVVLATVAVSLVVAQRTALKFEARMQGAGNIKGKAKFVVRGSGASRLGELELSGENLRRNQAYTITMSTGEVFQVTTDAFGDYTSNYRFAGATVPAIGAGTGTQVTDASGALIMQGSFAQR